MEAFWHLSTDFGWWSDFVRRDLYSHRMSESYPLAHGPAELEELVLRARQEHGRVELTEEDATVAVIISLADYQELQDAADQADIAAAEAVKKQGNWIEDEEAMRLLEMDDADPS